MGGGCLGGLHPWGGLSRGGLHPEEGGVCIRGSWADSPPIGYYGIRSRSGRYASYWNAFMFCSECSLLTQFVLLHDPKIGGESRSSLKQETFARILPSPSSLGHWFITACQWSGEGNVFGLVCPSFCPGGIPPYRAQPPSVEGPGPAPPPQLTRSNFLGWTSLYTVQTCSLWSMYGWHPIGIRSCHLFVQRQIWWNSVTTTTQNKNHDLELVLLHKSSTKHEEGSLTIEKSERFIFLTSQTISEYNLCETKVYFRKKHSARPWILDDITPYRKHRSNDPSVSGKYEHKGKLIYLK